MRIRIVNRIKFPSRGGVPEGRGGFVGGIPVANIPAIRALLRGFAERALDVAKWREICVLLVDDKESGEIHHATVGDPSPTDVITLRYIRGDAMDAELIVNVQCAMEEGRRRSRRGAWSPQHELALYLAHGIDHLSGADDATPANRARMRRRELRWMRYLQPSLHLLV